MAGPQLSGDTETSGQDGPGAGAPVRDGVLRPQPADRPGLMAGAWSKGCTDSPGGWDIIDDVEGASASGWRQT